MIFFENDNRYIFKTLYTNFDSLILFFTLFCIYDCKLSSLEAFLGMYTAPQKAEKHKSKKGCKDFFYKMILSSKFVTNFLTGSSFLWDKASPCEVILAAWLVFNLSLCKVKVSSSLKVQLMLYQAHICLLIFIACAFTARPITSADIGMYLWTNKTVCDIYSRALGLAYFGT